MIITFLAVIFFDLEMAIYIGVFLSIALFVRKSANSKITKVIPRDSDNKLFPAEKNGRDCKQVSIYQLEGELFFGSINELEDQLAKLKERQGNIVILRMKQVHIIDASGAHLIEDLLHECHENKGKLILTGVSTSVRGVLDKTGVTKKMDKKNIVADTTQAIKLALENYIDKDICKNCTTHIFNECK
jgi:SulP family sulfate permease